MPSDLKEFRLAAALVRRVRRRSSALGRVPQAGPLNAKGKNLASRSAKPQAAPTLTLPLSTRGGDKSSAFSVHNSAFTLLELVLVLVVICIILGEAAPQLRGFLIGSRLKNATTDLISATQWARTQSISQGQTYRLMVDDKGYQIMYQDQQQFVPAQDTMGNRFNLPADVRLSLSRQDGGMDDHIDFFSDGTTEPGTFTLTQNNNGEAKVVCLSPSERFHVDNGGAP